MGNAHLLEFESLHSVVVRCPLCSDLMKGTIKPTNGTHAPEFEIKVELCPCLSNLLSEKIQPIGEAATNLALALPFQSKNTKVEEIVGKVMGIADKLANLQEYVENLGVTE